MYLTIKDCGRDIVLLKLTTERHEASRGLFATAELLVSQRTVFHGEETYVASINFSGKSFLQGKKCL